MTDPVVYRTSSCIDDLWRRLIQKVWFTGREVNPDLVPTLFALQKIAYKIAKDHGFHDEKRDMSLISMLIVTEAAELFEGWRKNRGSDNIEEELADIVIRCLDSAEELNVDLEHAVLQKMLYNHDRPHKHGGKRV